MKQILRLFVLLAFVGYSSFIQAQTGSCSVTDLVVQNIKPVVGSPCTYTFDVAFTITSQSSKLVFFQSYVETSTLIPNNPYPYRNYWNCQNGTANINGAAKAPTSATIGTPFLNVAIDNSGSTPVLTNYIPDPTVPTTGVVATTGVTSFVLPDGNTRFNLTGLQVTLPSTLCGNPFVIITDFFATNANANGANVPIQCVTCGVRFAAGFFGVTGQANCSTLQYNITLTNNTAAALTGTYQLYADVNGNGLFTPGVDVLISAATPTLFTIGAGVGTTLPLSGTIPQAYGGMDLLLVTTLDGGIANGAQSITTITSTACAVLPVRFKSFNAVRKNQDVQLTWETASEDNNKGFYAQRNDGHGWKDLEFITTKATDGNSSSVLSYNYTDLNNTNRGVTQYRIMQVDIDGKAKLSDIRQVRGLEMSGKVIVYPNPSSDGKVNVVFEDSKSTWNVSVADMNGRTIKQYKGVTNSVLVDNLLPGMYMIRIVDTQSGAQTNEKVIVNNR